MGRVLDAHLGLCAIWMDFMVDWMSSLRSTFTSSRSPFDLPASSMVGLAGASRTIAFGIGFFSLGFFCTVSTVSTVSLASLASLASDFFGAARRLVRCLDGGTCSESPRASMSSSRPFWRGRSSPSPSLLLLLLPSSFSSFGTLRHRHPPPHLEALAIETRSFSLAPLRISRKINKDRAEYL